MLRKSLSIVMALNKHGCGMSSIFTACTALYLRCNTLSISYGMNRLGNILDVSIIQSGKANPTISGEENGVFRSELIAHFT